VPVEPTAWDPKPHATFHALLASLRQQIWLAGSTQTSPADPALGLLDPSRLDRLLSAACLSLAMDKVNLIGEPAKRS
jgi:hypothetical protein